jgi:hypothetical protein
MKILRCGLLSLTVLTLGLYFNPPALAEAKVLVSPEALTVTGIRGAVPRETRTLALRSTASVTNLRVYAFDLYNSDRDRIFPKRLITLPPALPQVNVDNLENLPIEFNLQDAPSGEFRGDILLSYQGTELTVPVIVRVKDPWYLPLGLLVFGVILGTTVSSYSRWGRTTDELTVNLESLRTQAENDPEIPPSFAARISTHLVDAKLARDTKQLEAARQSLVEARTVWGKWSRQRPEWLEALKIGTTVTENLAKLPSQALQTRYLQRILRDLKDTLARVADFANPNEFGQQINRYSRQQALYLRVYHQYLDLQMMLNAFKPSLLELPDRDHLQTLHNKTTDLRQQLSSLLPSDQPDQVELQVIETEINQAVAAVKALQAQADDTPPIDDIGDYKPGKGKSVTGEPSAPEPAIEVPVSSTPDIPTFSADENPLLKGIAFLIPQPNQRLQLFSLAGYLTTIVFLAGTGFNQLYLERPTFGADGLKDYFALLAWGFGAEATRSAVTNALRRTDESKP